MAGGSGHAIDMIHKMNYLRNQLKKQQLKYSEAKSIYFKIKLRYPEFQDRSNLSQEELIELKSKIRANIIRQRTRKIIFASLVFFIVICLVAYMIYFFLFVP
jgi:hypothetical protein